MAGKPYQSCLTPFEKEIILLRRRKPPMTFSQIAQYLHEKHEISVCPSNIRKFLTSRKSIHGKTCRHAWDIELDGGADAEAAFQAPLPATPAPASIPERKETSAPVLTPVARVAPVAKQSPKKKQEPTFRYQYSTENHLQRVSPEEAAETRKKLEQEENERKVKR
jgi:hypothetical protein